jgi:DNA-binding transcriptional LysR family regulator
MNDPLPVVPAVPPAEIELRAWRQFLVLAETLHFGRAAQRLHMTQPPLTQAIQQLERRVGALLFERTRRSVALAPAGAALVEPVRRLLAGAAALPVMARGAMAGESGRIRLGFVSTVGFGALPVWLRRFREANPGVAIELREATGDVQLEAFARRELDAGFLLHAPGQLPDRAARLHVLSLGIEPMVLALPEAAPWATAARLKAVELLAQPLVIFPRVIAPSLYDAVLAFHHRHGVAPVIAQEAIQMQTIVNLVSAGLGVALVPQAVTQLQRPGVVYRPLPRALADAAPRCETSLVWPDDALPAVLRFVDFVRDQPSMPLGYRSR